MSKAMGFKDIEITVKKIANISLFKYEGVLVDNDRLEIWLENKNCIVINKDGYILNKDIILNVINDVKNLEDRVTMSGDDNFEVLYQAVKDDLKVRYFIADLSRRG